MSQAFDLAVIGTGPGGYVCAIRAAQLGMTVAVVEKRKTHGGTCLNVGCIPSKALLHSTELLETAENDFAKIGIKTSKVAADLPAMMAHKGDVVKANVNGVGFLLNKNKITAFHGAGEFISDGELKITDEAGKSQTISAKNFVIATGSEVTPLPGVTIDEDKILSSTGALELNTIPKSMVVVGAGVIGLELGSVWRRMGTKVTVVEYLDRILPGIDGETAKQFQRLLQKQGMDFHLSTKVDGIVTSGKGVKVKISPDSGGDPSEIKADCALVAIGRRPYTEGLGLEAAGISLDERGRVLVNDHLQTAKPHIFAIGDVIAGPMLAHKAEEDGVFVAELLAGQKPHIDYDLVPSVVYTYPEIASIGKTEEQLKEAGIAYNAGKFPFMANGRARANHQTDGFVKILADKTTDRVLGVHIIGPMAGELIGEACVLMGFGGSSEDLARICHAHPTLSEAIKEAALGTFSKPIHS